MRILNTLLHDFQDHLARQRNRAFLKSVMAACAMVASADGEVSFAQRIRLDQILETLDKLKIFDPHEGIDMFNIFSDGIMENSSKGHAKAWEALVLGAPGRSARELLIRVCLAISEANKERSLADQIEIVTLCNRLGVRPENCGLYVDDPEFQSLNKDD
jgi:tellurite resistance protein